MLWQQQDSIRSQPFTDQAIRDTIAQIVKQPAYGREIRQSVSDRIWRWIIDQLNQFFNFVSDIPYGRTIAMSLVVVAVLLVVARLVIGIRAEQMAKHPVRRKGVASSGATSLADAERLAANGDYTSAAHALFSSLLAAGAARGEFRVHPSKTTGDYVRELRRKNATWFRPFQAFRSRYDRVIYGDMQCSASDYHALMGEVRIMMERDRAA